MTPATPPEFGSRFTAFGIGVLLSCWVCCQGCATVPYKYGHFQPDNEMPKELAFEYGRPQKVVDGLAWTMGIWSRVLALNPNVNNHELTEKTKDKLIAYMDDNDLNDVLVRVNQYDPMGEWRRLRGNKRVGAGWRYTIGVCTLMQYSLIPGRIFGGDYYNSFTNSLYINSDVPAIVLHEAAYAKDIHSRFLPGTYAFVNELPMISLWRHTNGVNDVLGYAQINDDWAIEKETYRVVYPTVGIDSVVLVGTFVPILDGVIVSVVGAAAGHATGQMALSQRTRQRGSAMDELQPEAEFEPDEMQVGQSDILASDVKIRFAKHEKEPAADE